MHDTSINRSILYDITIMATFMVISLLFMVGALCEALLWTIDKTMCLIRFIITHILKLAVKDKPDKQ